jgi:hypothetical protein
MISHPCVSAGIRIPCDLCNRHFRSQEYFDNHKKKTQGKIKKSACDLSKCTCGSLMTQKKKHECNKRSCVTCNENKEIGYLCFMRPLKKEPLSGEHIQYVF